MAVLMPEPQGTALGLTTVYADQYDPKLLFPISRNIGRDAIGDHDFIGTDIWRMYEFSWLNANGLPQAAALLPSEPSFPVLRAYLWRCLHVQLSASHRVPYSSPAAFPAPRRPGPPQR